MTSLANLGALMRAYEGRETDRMAQDFGKTLTDHQVIHANDTMETANRPLVAVRNEMLSSTGAVASRRAITTDPNANVRRYVGHETPYNRRMRIMMGDINATHFQRG